MKNTRATALEIATERARYWQAVAKELGMEEKKSRLVDDWRSAWKWASMWLHVIGTTVLGLFVLIPAMPKELQALIPAQWQAAVVAVWFIAGIAARLVKQRG